MLRLEGEQTVLDSAGNSLLLEQLTPLVFSEEDLDLGGKVYFDDEQQKSAFCG